MTEVDFLQARNADFCETILKEPNLHGKEACAQVIDSGLI